MKKYIIEDEIDFYKELNEVMNVKIDKDKMLQEEQDDDFCLITKTQLNDRFVRLSCGHSFNYSPLYNEIYKQRYATNTYYSKDLKSGFKCPYCRQIQQTVLPYYSDMNLPILYGINTDNMGFYLEEKIKQKKEQHLKQKIAIKEKYEIAKEQKKLAKEQKKIEVKELKAAQKAAIIVTTCTKILKTGKNKGKPCGCKAFKDDLCKKHGVVGDAIVS